MHLSVEQQQEGIRHKWVVSFADSVLFSCDKRFFSSRELTSLPSETKEAFLEAFFALEYKKALSFSLARLAKSAVHSERIKKLLTERFVHKKTQEKVIFRLEELFLIDDVAYIEAFVRKNVQKSKSFLEISKKAQIQGLPPSQVKEVLGVQKTKNDAKIALKKLISQRFSCLFLPNQDKNEVFKAKRRLYMRGFSSAVIENVLQELKEEV